MSSDFAHRLKYLRMNANLTQKELAEKLNTTGANISKYELGRTFPTADLLLRITDFFAVSCDYLLGVSDNPARSDEEFKDLDYIYILGSDGTRKLISIPPEKRDRVRAMLSAGFPELMNE